MTQITFWAPVLAAIACSAVTVSLTAVSFAAGGNSLLQTPQTLSILVALAIGSLIGDVAFHLIPDAFTNPKMAGPGFFLGIFVFLVGERILQQHHTGHGHEHIHLTQEEAEEDVDDSHQENNHLGILVIVSDLVHNFIDGVALAFAYAASPAAGHSTAVAICMHEIPHELGDIAILLAFGYTKRQIFGYVLATAATSLIGVLVATAMQRILVYWRPFVMAFSAGNFIYLALSDLVPELLHHREPQRKHLIEQGAVMAGSLLMFIFKLFF